MPPMTAPPPPLHRHSCITQHLPLLVHIPNQCEMADLLVLRAARPSAYHASQPLRFSCYHKNLFCSDSRYRFNNYGSLPTTRSHHGQRPFDFGKMAGIRCRIAARLQCKAMGLQWRLDCFRFDHGLRPERSRPGMVPLARCLPLLPGQSLQES